MAGGQARENGDLRGGEDRWSVWVEKWVEDYGRGW